MSLSIEELKATCKHDSVTISDVTKIISKEFDDIEIPPFITKGELLKWFHEFYTSEKQKFMESGVSLAAYKDIDNAPPVEHEE